MATPLPPLDVPVVDRNGIMSQAWYSYFQSHQKSVSSTFSRTTTRIRLRRIKSLVSTQDTPKRLICSGKGAMRSIHLMARPTACNAPLVASTTAGSNAYGDASGANGVAGLQNAMNTFKNSGQYGAYGFSLDQGLQALDRTHAAAGNLSSGNADTDAMKYATGLAGQTYNSYLSGLSPYLGANSSAVSGAAGAQNGPRKCA
jgi:hypothetical protein